MRLYTLELAQQLARGNAQRGAGVFDASAAVLRAPSAHCSLAIPRILARSARVPVFLVAAGSAYCVAAPSERTCHEHDPIRRCGMLGTERGGTETCGENNQQSHNAAHAASRGKPRSSTSCVRSPLPPVTSPDNADPGRDVMVTHRRFSNREMRLLAGNGRIEPRVIE